MSFTEVPRLTGLALSMLAEACRCAQTVGRTIWDFAVEIECLRAAGVTNTNLRYLICAGYAEHGMEVTQPTSRARAFRKLRNLRFTDKTCLILTEMGESLAQKAGVNAEISIQPTHNGGNNNHNGKHVVIDNRAPKWVRDRRELRMGDLVVKHFTVPAPNQEIVFEAFEEEGWPFRIYDPLPPHNGLDPKRRLHETINKLNAHQIHPLIRFRGDGTGRGVCWELRWSSQAEAMLTGAVSTPESYPQRNTAQQLWSSNDSVSNESE